jgi:hypothetical protein
MKVGLCCLFLTATTVFAQETQTKRLRSFQKKFQFSIFPGISTNGIASGFYFNDYSFNLFGGVSAGNSVLEMGLFTNSHFQSSTGIQLAGFANISGTNAFINFTLWEERALIHDDFEVNNKGVMIAGIVNYTLNHTEGVQFTGGFNHSGNNFSGFQFAGIGNSAGGHSAGVHLAGLYNIVNESASGIQISTLFNYTDGQLGGSQVALINKARWMKGRNSTPLTRIRSIQIGFINFSKEMHGTQIGFINFGGEMRGKQIGLINFFKRLKSKENANAGTPIGLLNLGSFGSVMRLYANDIFAANIEYTTGNCQNCTWTPAGPVGMPYNERYKIKNQNALIVGVDPFRDRWGFGYGFIKIMTNKVTSAPSDRNERFQMTYGVRFLHLNSGKTFDTSFNLLSRFSFDVGKKYRSRYLFAGVAVNYFLYKNSIQHERAVNSLALSAGNILDLKTQLWPGYVAGIQF